MIYIYEFEDGETVEVEQGITDPKHTELEHPKTGKIQPVTRLISTGIGAVFVGDNWASAGKKGY